MKKIYLASLGLLFVAGSVFSQRVAGEWKTLDYKADYLLTTDNRNANDTLFPNFLEGCDIGPYSLLSNNGGFVAGGNGYGDLEKAQFIPASAPGSIYSLLALMGGKTGGSNQSYSAFVYNGTAASGPTGAAQATSAPVTYANIDTTLGFTAWTFNTPQPYTNGFFLSIEVAQGNAFIGVAHTNAECGGGAAWEKWENGLWFAMNDAGSWGLDVVFWMFAEVESESVSVEDTHLIVRGSEKVVPNPAQDQAMLVFSLTESVPVNIQVFNITGQLVKTYSPGQQNTGLNMVEMNTSDMGQGVYIYSIQTPSETRTGRFNVIR